jgi:hypothetical protein
MKMSIFVSFARARLVIEGIKGSDLVAVRHMIDQLARRWLYPWKYMSIICCTKPGLQA